MNQEDKRVAPALVTEEQAKALYSLIICDDFPNKMLSEKQDEAIKMLADEIAKEFGYKDWITHYHSIKPEETGQMTIEDMSRLSELNGDYSDKPSNGGNCGF